MSHLQPVLKFHLKSLQVPDESYKLIQTAISLFNFSPCAPAITRTCYYTLADHVSKRDRNIAAFTLGGI